jgi:cell division protein FtsB
MSVRHPERASGPFHWLSFATVAFLVAVIAVAGAASYKDLTAARAQETALRERVAATRAHVEALERQVKRLADDPETLERVAREELGLVGPHDIVVVLPEERLRGEGKEGE